MTLPLHRGGGDQSMNDLEKPFTPERFADEFVEAREYKGEAVRAQERHCFMEGWKSGAARLADVAQQRDLLAEQNTRLQAEVDALAFEIMPEAVQAALKANPQ